MQRGGAGRRGSSYKVEFSAKQCRAARDNIVKTIYNHIFEFVVDKVTMPLPLNSPPLPSPQPQPAARARVHVEPRPQTPLTSQHRPRA